MATNKNSTEPGVQPRPASGSAFSRDSGRPRRAPYPGLALWVLPLLLWMGVAGCQPQGPKALLEGDRLFKQGRVDEALRLFKMATERMPREARAWNLLGLALHARGDLAEAGVAYQKALALNHRLSDARFNLGSLLLEQDQPHLAVNELTAYTMLQGRDIDGWLKLAKVQMRLNRLDAAEISYRTALTLTPRNAEAFNGLGMIQVTRRRFVEAVQYFQAALADSPGHAPALYNQAMVTHRYLNQRTTALQKYRQYLALQPRPENWEAVSLITQSLVDELSGGSRPATVTSTNPIVARPPAATLTNAAPATAAALRSPVATNTPPVSRSGSPSVQPGSTVTPPETNPLAPQPTIASPPAPVPPKPAVATTTPPSTQPRPPIVEPGPPPLAVAEVSTGIALKPPQEIIAPPVPPPVPAPVPPPVAGRPASNGTLSTFGSEPSSPPATPVSQPAARDERPGFFSRLNPFRSRDRAEAPPPSSVSVPMPASPTPAPAPTAVPAGVWKRYAYRQIGRPQVGDRQKASELVQKGLMAHQDRRFDDEMAFYRSASLVDPSSFDAFFNMGLVSAERGDWSTALACYEQALAIDPDSVSSRFNFATALRQTEHISDSAREFETILQSHPRDAKTLLALGNLHAQRLKQTRTARQYYLRMLEADPNHPKASEVRFWLTANP